MEREVDEAVWKSQGRECTKNEEETILKNRRIGNLGRMKIAVRD